MPAYQDRLSWYVGSSAYWFASSAKYFILLLTILPGQVKQIVPEGEHNTYWGLVFSIGAIWAIFGPAIFGYVSDALGRRRPLIAIGAASTVIALMVLMNATELWMLIVGYLLLQVSDDVGQGAYQSVIPELVPADRRGRASGIMAFLEQMAQIAIALIGMALGDVKLIYVALALINIVCAIWTIYTISGARQRVANRSGVSISTFLRSWLAPWHSRDFAWAWITRFLNALGFYMAENYLRFYLEDNVKVFSLFGMKFDIDKAVLVVGLTIALFGGIGAVLSAKFADRVGRKRVIYTAGTAMSILLIPFALVPDYQVIWILSIGFGVGYGAYLGATWALISDVLPRADAVATDMGIWAASLTLGQLLAGQFGRVIDAINRMQPGMGYSATFLASAAMFLASTAFVKAIKGST